MNMLDIFNDDAFSAVSLSAAISNIDTVPGMAGQLAFAGAGEGVPSLSVAIERKSEVIELIPEQPRGAPAPKETVDKRNLISFHIPHFPLEDTIRADEVQNQREFGTTEPASVESLVARQLRKMNLRFDFTLEHLRLGAVKGQIVGSTGDVLVDLFEDFGILNSDGLPAPETFYFDLENYSSAHHIRTVCANVRRFIERNSKTLIPATWNPVAFCGDNFFDKLVYHPSVKGAYAGTEAAIERLGGNFAGGSPFEFGGIVFTNYVGSDDNSTVAIDADECRIFPSGIPGVFREWYAPADFMETANTIGLPRYAKVAPDRQFNRWIELHAQMNPLPLCTRPKVLVRGVSDAPSE